MPLRIGICGPTGSGKTTLARALGAFHDVGLVLEPQPLELLSAFSLDPPAGCFPLQTAIIRGRVAGAQLTYNESMLVFDRTVEEDLEVFVALHRRNGFLDDSQVDTLSRLAATAQCEIGVPDLYVVLAAEYGFLHRRLAAARPPQVVLDSLEDQLALYVEWRAKLAGKVLVEIDTSMRSVDEVSLLAGWIRETALAATYGALEFNARLGVGWQLGTAPPSCATSSEPDATSDPI